MIRTLDDNGVKRISKDEETCLLEIEYGCYKGVEFRNVKDDSLKRAVFLNNCK